MTAGGLGGGPGELHDPQVADPLAVLPAFQGNVPPPLAALEPQANISLQGTGRHWAAWLDALDPLFAKVGDAWMGSLAAVLGEGGGAAFDGCWFEADGYFTAGRP